MNAEKKHQQILRHNRRIHSSNGQTWTTSAIPETNFARTFEGDHKKASGESQKDNNGYVDLLGIRRIYVRDVVVLILYSAGRLFRW
jgi:hypothetical protein